MSQKVDVFILSFCLFINKASRKIIFVILQVWAHISKQNANCKLILFISLHSNNEHFISHIYQIIWCFHLRFLLFYNKASKEANDHMSKKGMMLAFNATLLLSLAFISIRWADLSILAIGEVLIRNRKKTSYSYQVGANFMFSFVSIAKPGKHFLIETDEEDGQPENGPVPNDYAGELLFYRTCCVSFSKWCDDSKVNIFVLQCKSFGNWDDLVSFLNKTITAVLGGSKAFWTMLKKLHNL